MRKLTNIGIIFVLSCVVFLTPVFATDKKEVSPAPPPAQIAASQKVFISNGGQDASFSAFTKRRAYDQFYAAMQGWGKTTIAGSPSDADIVLEISLVNELRPFGDQLRSLPVLQLTILDPKTHIKLWVCSEELESGNFVFVGARQDNKFDKAMDRLVADVTSLLAKSTAASKS